jgi:Heterokaryon incompatibility protein (HET)
MEIVQAYNGQDLDASKHQIRILELLGGSGSDKIECKSSVVSLEHNPAYTALSYVWGNDKDLLLITLNGYVDFPIIRNLYIALKYLRKEDEAVTLWVDALCINQKNTIEKNHQVKIMGEIYTKATHTCIWLGEGADDSDLAMQLIRKLDGNNMRSPDNNISPSGLEAIAKLQQRPWWSRVWVIQGTEHSNVSSALMKKPKSFL